MPRKPWLLVIAALACGCGKPSPDKDLQSPPAPEAIPAQTTTAATAAEGGSSPGLQAVNGPARASKYMELAVVEAGFDSTAPPASSGQRHYTVGLRGTGRARGSDLALEVERFVYAQNDRGCISRPNPNAAWLKEPLGATAVFTRGQQTQGQLSFLVPEDTQRVRILVAAGGAGDLVVPAGEDFTPSWPSAIQTIDDGATLRVLVLPTPEKPLVLPPPTSGRELFVLDVVIENLTADQGVEFTTSQQLRMVDQSGKFVQASIATQHIGCRLDDGDVIPPGHARRLMVAYEMPPGEPRRLNYRGFEVDEVNVDLN